MHKNLVVSACFGALLAAAGCTTAANFATEDRSFSSSVNDVKTEAELKSDMFQKDYAMPVDVGTIVSEGRVMLFGYVDTQKELDNVHNIIEKKNFSKVYDHIRMRPKGNVVDAVKDAYYEKKIWAKLFATENLRSANYKIKVYDRVAYVLGSTTTTTERAKAYKIIKNTDGIKKVVFEVSIIGR